MPKVLRRSEFPVSRQELFAWHARPGAFERLSPPWDDVEIEARTGGLEVGASTQLKLSVGPVPQRWKAVHTAFEDGHLFVDEQQGGPFASWKHTHRFGDAGAGRSFLEDEIDYELPLGALGRMVGARYAASRLDHTFSYRHEVLGLDLARHAPFLDRKRLTITVTGGSGLVASALIPFLQTGGHTVRKAKRGPDNTLDPADFEGADAVIHLAGAGVADERWTTKRKALLVSSRVDFTRQLVRVLGGLRARPTVLLSGSAIGIYGDRGDEVLSEDSAMGKREPTGPGFLAGLCMDWEAEAVAARALGLRVVPLRIGLVQSAAGGALKKLVVPFSAGFGGPVGDGKQWQSWICLEDLIGALHWALWRPELDRPVNLVAPTPLTSKAYAKVLGKVLGRPAIAPLPKVMLRATFGELADGALLASQRVAPGVLQAGGFSFVHPELEQTLRFTLGRPAPSAT